METTTFSGLLTLNGIAEGPNTPADGKPTRAFGLNTLLMGNEFGRVNDDAPATFSGQPDAL